MGMFKPPAAPGTASSTPGQRDQMGPILSGQQIQLLSPDLHGAEDVLSSNPPTAGSTGEKDGVKNLGDRLNEGFTNNVQLT